MTGQARHHEETTTVMATPADVFAYLDDPARLTSHMGKSSWMMGGGRMDVSVDQGKGQTTGSHIRLDGTAFGLRVFLDEVVTKREPPFEKQWQTAGAHRLLVIGDYTMGLKVEPAGAQSKLRIFIHYELPRENAWLGTLFAGFYAKSCVGMMLNDARAHFAEPRHAS
jgi:carbon monoxide dehydrogenase subunit G